MEERLESNNKLPELKAAFTFIYDYDYEHNPKHRGWYLCIVRRGDELFFDYIYYDDVLGSISPWFIREWNEELIAWCDSSDFLEEIKRKIPPLIYEFKFNS